jgi:hypothetical protein
MAGGDDNVHGTTFRLRTDGNAHAVRDCKSGGVDRRSGLQHQRRDDQQAPRPFCLCPPQDAREALRLAERLIANAVAITPHPLK